MSSGLSNSSKSTARVWGLFSMSLSMLEFTSLNTTVLVLGVTSWLELGFSVAEPIEIGEDSTSLFNTISFWSLVLLKVLIRTSALAPMEFSVNSFTSICSKSNCPLKSEKSPKSNS